MVKFKYAFQNYDPSKHTRASAREIDISHKHAREIACHIRGMDFNTAYDFLKRVVSLQSAVPMRRYKRQVGHKSDPHVMAGRYPQKAAKAYLSLLDNLESNAEHIGMDTGRLYIVNATVHKGMLIKRFTPRAMGSATPKNNTRTHIELVAAERSDDL